MEQAHQRHGDLPGRVADGLQRFCTQLEEAFGEELVSVVLYGGLAKGDSASLRTDANVMVILSDVTIEALDRILAPVQQGLRDFGLALLLLSENDLRSSTDAFPIKFLDIKRHHRVLWGKDVMADVAIATDHLRLRCEQEIKNLLLRLRQFYLQRAHRPELIESTLNSAISSFLTSLNVLLQLKTGAGTTGKTAIAEAAGNELGLNAKPLHEILAMKEGRSNPDVAEMKRIYGDFMVTVQAAADIVDQL